MKKCNPIWWLGNENDPVTLAKHDEFYKGRSLWHRKLMWAIRNPFHNFCFFVIGMYDKKELVNLGETFPKKGQKWNICLPLICYKGEKREWYIGWRKGIAFGIAFRKANSEKA
jgi:hypothetical protein